MSVMEFDEGAKALAFLKSHRLRPTPQNYTVAYHVLHDAESPIARAIEAITDEGFRIKQQEVDTILERHGSSISAAPDESGKVSLATQLRHQSLKLSELTSSAADATGAFARELSEEAGAFTGDSANALSMITRMVEQSLQAEKRLKAADNEVKALREELEAARNDAQRDQLTGLANRRAIEAFLAELGEKGAPRIIALCDIDDFKSVNDRYGHGVGDRVIKLVANTLRDTCEPHFVGRWGGEEFIFIMASDDVEKGIGLLDRARKELAGKEFKLRETDEPMGLISFSGGVALGGGSAETNAATLRAADDALYRAKSSGKNRITAAED